MGIYSIRNTEIKYVWGLIVLSYLFVCLLFPAYIFYDQPVITTRIYALHKITIALKFMSYITSDLLIPSKKMEILG